MHIYIYIYIHMYHQIIKHTSKIHINPVMSCGPHPGRGGGWEIPKNLATEVRENGNILGFNPRKTMGHMKTIGCYQENHRKTRENHRKTRENHRKTRENHRKTRKPWDINWGLVRCENHWTKWRNFKPCLITGGWYLRKYPLVKTDIAMERSTIFYR